MWRAVSSLRKNKAVASPGLPSGSYVTSAAFQAGVSGPMTDNQEEPPLPAGWSEAVTAEGEKYYVNHVTKTTTWDRPTNQPETEKQQTSIPFQDNRGTIPITSSLAASTVEPDQKEPSLPAEWSEGVTTDGKKYYRNHVTQTSTWDRLTAQPDTVNQAVPALDNGSIRATTSSLAVSTPVSDQKEPPLPSGNRGTIPIFSSLAASTVEPDQKEPPLPADNRGTIPIISSWAANTVEPDQKEPPLPADNGNITATTSSLDVSTPVSGQKEPLLPSGWSEGFTTDGKKYYRNHVAMTTTWDRPTAAADTPPVTQATYASVANPAVSPLGSRTSSTFSVAVTATEADQKEDHISTGWSEGVIVMGDGNKDNEYVVKTSKWDRLTTKANTASKDALQLGSSSSTPHTTSSSYESTTFRNAKADQDESSLPRGWSEGVTSDGKKYYVNYITKTIARDRPTAQAETANQAVPSSGGTDSTMHAANSEAEGTAAEISTQGSSSSTPLATPFSAVSNFKADRKVTPLFGGWSEGVMAGGKKYYINHITKIITWDRPTAQAETENQAVPSSGSSKEMRTASSVPGIVEVDKVDKEDPPLPSEWSEKAMPNGEKFYVNHRLKITSWDRPTNQA